MSWSELSAGLVGAVVGAAATILLQRWHERRSTLEHGRFRVYMLLLELHAVHFWIVSSEVRSEECRAETLVTFNRLRWRIADELRKLDRLSDLEVVLRAMFGLHYESERERAEELSKALDQLGRDVNPRYTAAMAKITEDNQALMATNLEEFVRRQKKVEPL